MSVLLSRCSHCSMFLIRHSIRMCFTSKSRSKRACIRKKELETRLRMCGIVVANHFIIIVVLARCNQLDWKSNTQRS